MKDALHVIVWLLGFFLLWKIPTLKKKEGQPARRPASLTRKKLSVIIPARNEEGVLEKLLRSLNRQNVRAHEIIVVNDGSTDRTSEVANAAGARVINLDEPLEGWTGKNWACYTGAKNASGDAFLFLDADTWLEPDGLEQILDFAAEYPGVITISPFHHIEEPYENLSLFFNVMAGAGLRTFTALGDRIEPAGLFGPCFFCSREDYFAIDGHASVKGSIVDDVDIGSNFVQAGIPLKGFGGEGSVNVRMYERDIHQLVRGWTKNIGIGAKLTSPVFVALISLWFAGAFRAAVDLLARLFSLRAPTPRQSLIYAAYAAQIRWMSRRSGNFSPWASVLFPIPLFFAGYIYVRSYLRYARGKEVNWKGRAISTQDTAR